MSRIDVRDKDPFANTEDAPKDNVTAGGVLARLTIRYALYYIFWGLIGAAVAGFVYNISCLRNKNLVGPTGFEPVASRLSVGCSNQAKLRARGFATGIGDLRLHVRHI